MVGPAGRGAGGAVVVELPPLAVPFVLPPPAAPPPLAAGAAGGLIVLVNTTGTVTMAVWRTPFVNIRLVWVAIDVKRTIDGCAAACEFGGPCEFDA